MKKSIKNTLGNWRWWVVTPYLPFLFIILLCHAIVRGTAWLIGMVASMMMVAADEMMDTIDLFAKTATLPLRWWHKNLPK